MRAPGLVHVMTVPDSLEFLRGQLAYMAARGFAVRAVTAPGPGLARLAAELGVPVTAVAMRRAITPRADLAAVCALRRLLRRHRPAIVHAHTPKGGLVGMLAATLARTPVRIYHMRGLPLVTATGATRRLLRATERLSCALAHRVLCVSPSLRAVAVAERLCPPSKITVLGAGSGNGVDATGRYDPHRLRPDVRLSMRTRLGVGDQALVVGFAGRIVRDKGVVELVQAWQAIRAAHERAHLLVIGPLEARDAVPPAVVETLRRDPRVHLVDSSGEMPSWYTAIDVVVLPTHREGFPNVLLEAAAMRLPVVATRVPGCVDAVEDGVTGTLVPARDAGALARAVEAYVMDPALRRRHGDAGRARVLAHFRPEQIWSALYAEYCRLLDRTRATAPAASRPPGGAGAAASRPIAS